MSDMREIDNAIAAETDALRLELRDVEQSARRLNARIEVLETARAKLARYLAAEVSS